MLYRCKFNGTIVENHITLLMLCLLDPKKNSQKPKIEIMFKSYFHLYITKDSRFSFANNRFTSCSHNPFLIRWGFCCVVTSLSDDVHDLFCCFRNPLAQMEEEKREHDSKMKKMEAEMEQVFEMKVKEKKQKLKDSELELTRRHEERKKVNYRKFSSCCDLFLSFLPF